MQDDSASSSPTPPRQASPSVARSLPGGNRADNEAEAAAQQVQKALDPSLPRALRDAARVGNAREVESLIGQGVPVDGRDTAGRTALMIAALNGHTAAVQELLALGAQTSLVDGDGLTASQHARRWGYSAIAELIDAAR
jgi:ankyrin repeat protein